ncbi:endonuclease MutS2 [Sutcliffiella rhizosphaerae]|uniref:Endonuclease MutS2 n=1 Tax=Sutcliffiella rhizosphaerae TaxID=2880967 RepID=A0ABM8YNW7_9BACI|nr:endonuclease MutS2 [Sutcliffiella rhizosphaerae]CAG9621572.1 Endonuclease MutS2 [Sutcliffiella rhizosphaerae]
MNKDTIQALQFNEVKKEIASYAISEPGKRTILNLEPSFYKKQIEALLNEVTEGKRILQISSSVPIHGLQGIEYILKNLHKGVAFRPDQLMGLFDFLETIEKLKRFMKDKEYAAPVITTYIYSVSELSQVANEIIKCIRNGRVDDYASKELLKIRKQLSTLEERIKARMEQLVKSSKYSKYLQESIISTRNGRYVIPVKNAYKNQMKGSVLDVSASGSTVYIEPEEISVIQDSISMLKYQEEAEEEQILFALTGLVQDHEREIKLALDLMVNYDVIFAKAKHSMMLEGTAPQINTHHLIRLVDARHPLLGKDAVPLNVVLGEDFDALVITGPNTGGKTVTIKTVGLLTLMSQCGMHIPVGKESEIAIFQKILVDIGDGQSIEQSLSTFSSRIKNIIGILEEANPQTLVLLDELGSGTDPAEGMGIATSILEELYKKGTTMLATTHYSEIKEFANEKEGFINGSMEFDVETLKPTFRLVVGKGGESQAFAIALRLGMHPKLIERAHQITYKEEKGYMSNIVKPMYELEKQLAMNSKYIRKMKHPEKEKEKQEIPFKKGDNVRIPSINEFGIVHTTADSLGNLEVLVKGTLQVFNHKRLSLYIKAEDLYTEEYDLDIVFESKENRKLRNQMKKRHIDDVILEKPEE